MRVSNQRLPFELAVGITGHRPGRLNGVDLDDLAKRLGDVLSVLKSEGERLAREEARWFAPGPSRSSLVAPLAAGADQLAARIALDLGYRLHAVLPFDEPTYREDFNDGEERERFDRLLVEAECRLELPGSRIDAEAAYAMAGRATVAHCDVLIALWDGGKAHGRGGTGDVVAIARDRGTPVVHLPVERGAAPRLLWSAFDPNVLTREHDGCCERPFHRDAVAKLLAALLAPPNDPQERHFLEEFERERRRRWRLRIEYPLLLSLLGLRPFNRRDVDGSATAGGIREEWQVYAAACTRRHGVDASLEVLEASYAAADGLAVHFAQSHRSGHIFNFILAATAALVGLSGQILKGHALPLAAIEFALALAVLANTRVGMTGDWHRRWLDYRQLAERLRPLRSLKLLGIAAPDPPGTAAYPVARRWIDWYAAAAWRATGCPIGRIDAECATALAHAISEHEVGPQLRYHAANAALIERLDHRLERLATGLFVATLAQCLLVIVALIVAPDWVSRWSGWLTFVSAGLPAIGTAIFGIRFQGDFGGSALRSRGTAAVLGAIERDLSAPGIGLPRAADLAEQSARAMFADLDEWRLVNQQHDLSVS